MGNDLGTQESPAYMRGVQYDESPGILEHIRTVKGGWVFRCLRKIFGSQLTRIKEVQVFGMNSGLS